MTKHEEARLLALKYLSYKDRTEKEIYDKLISYARFDEADILRAIDWLKERGYVDDEKFAARFALSKANNSLDGPFKVKRALVLKGIDSEIAENAVCALEEGQAENAARLIIKKTKSKCGGDLDYKEKKKIFNFLLRKGYSISAINEGFKLVNSEIDVEWE